MKPTVGRIVHYGYRQGMNAEAQSIPIQTHAAIITRVNGEETVHLHIFFAYGGSSSQLFVKYSETLTEDCWTWPSREPSVASEIEALELNEDQTNQSCHWVEWEWGPANTTPIDSDWDNIHDLWADIEKFAKENLGHTFICADGIGRFGWVAFIENAAEEKAKQWTITLSNMRNTIKDFDKGSNFYAMFNSAQVRREMLKNIRS